MKNFRDLTVWEKAHKLTLTAYQATRAFPLDERYGLTGQIRRCSASIPANIAEACGRRGDGEFHRFQQVAMGSAAELEYHFLLAHDLKYLQSEEYQQLHEGVEEIKRMLASLISKFPKIAQRQLKLTADC